MEQKLNWNIYHYTDINALVGILQKDHIVLRASNIMYLNDSRELKEGIDIVKEVENRDINPLSFRNYFITSFSNSEDNLTMWGMYAANGSGCALAFDFDEISKSYEIVSKCIYGANDIKSHLDGFLRLSRSGSIVNIGGPQLSKEEKALHKRAMEENTILISCLTAKNEAFSYEKETRGIICCHDNELVKFRSRNNYIVPYIEVPIQKRALKKVIIGPTSNSELTMQSLIHLLAVNGYDLDTVVQKSQIPYRG